MIDEEPVCKYTVELITFSKPSTLYSQVALAEFAFESMLESNPER